jgi:hypothetical protein
MTEDLVAFADFKSVVSNREIRKVGSIPTRPRSLLFLKVEQKHGLPPVSDSLPGRQKVWEYCQAKRTHLRPMRIPTHQTRTMILFVATLWFCAAAFGQEQLRVGGKAPDFELPALGGKKIALREFQNKKIVIVHFWKSK